MLTIKQLQDIATQLRKDSLIMTSAAGSGHPTSCLSCAEIMSVLFFDTMRYNPKNAKHQDNDEFILSKGHAAPILYAALKHAGCINHDLLTLRMLNSPLQGHPIPSSLTWIKVATGSLGQGLSNGVGMALGAKLHHKRYKTYVLMGDSEIAEGSVWEALELAAHYKLGNLTAIIDVNRLGQTGETMHGHDVGSIKRKCKAFGAQVYTINGHSIGAIQNAMRKSNSIKDKPIVIIAKTYKGKGITFLENKSEWHGKALNEEELELALMQLDEPIFPKFHPHEPLKSVPLYHKQLHKISTNYNKEDKVATRQAFGDALVKLAPHNDFLVALDAEVGNSTHTANLQKESRRKFIQCYIAEQNMIGVAAGLSAKRHTVFASTFAAFLTRAHDQIRMAALSDLDFTIVGSHAGVSIGEDGGSQMGLEDIAMMRCLPNSVVLYPCDAVSTQHLTRLAAATPQLTYIRTSRPKTHVIYPNNTNFAVGGLHTVFTSSTKKISCVIGGAGITVHEALAAAQTLDAQGIGVKVVDLYCVKPFPTNKLSKLVEEASGNLVIVEDHHPEGGIGEAALNVACRHRMHLAVRKPTHSGKKDELLGAQNINARAIVTAVKKILRSSK